MLDQLHTMLADQVRQVESSHGWQAWLRFASSFHTYSFSNTLLIYAQRRNATAVAGYRGWQARGRQVRRGETAIRILGPVTRRVELLDTHGRPVLDDHGQPHTQTQMLGVKPVSVWDVSQTEGDPLPEPPRPVLLRGEAPPGLWDSLTQLIQGEGFTVTRGDCGGANGITMFDRREVRVRDDVDDLMACKTLCHEAAHVLLHADTTGFECRGVREVEAESVSYLTLASHQADSSQYTFTYVTGWAQQAAGPGGDVAEVVRATGQRVISTAHRILHTTQPTSVAGPDQPTRDGTPIDRAPAAGRVADLPVWERTDRPVLTGAQAARRTPHPRVSPQLGVAR